MIAAATNTPFVIYRDREAADHSAGGIVVKAPLGVYVSSARPGTPVVTRPGLWAAPEMMRTVERRSFTYRATKTETRIAMATLGNEAGLYGAAYLPWVE